jgi:hypothetical protein
MAFIGRLIGGLGGLAIGGVAVWGATGGFDDNTTRNEAGEITESGGVGAFVIRVGDCFEMPEESLLTSVEGVPCTDPHGAQVFAEFDMTDAETYPGDDAVTEEAGTGCVDRWMAAIGTPYDDMPDYDLQPISPSSETWDTGDRKVSCVIVRTDGADMTASMLAAATP